ncbi:MAG TPA: rod shape-determining protein MreC [Candidatus Paceibacterota bacterium]|nr:rod shape-determining protein MreC [Candidatus Paceibacterota bacterium]
MRSVGSFFVSKNSLYLENENLKSQLSEITATMANYNSVLDENNSLKEILGRINEKPMTLSAILAKPNKSFYDTLVIDAGINQRVETGDLVFAFGNVPIGRISIAYPNSSKVVLFSDSGEKTQAIVSLGHSTTGELGDAGKNVSIEVIGRGGGNFETTMPSDFTLVKGDEVVLPGITPYVLAVVETIISDPRDPFVKVLLTSPVNIQEQKFVEIETQK